MNKYVNNVTLPNGTNVLIKDLEGRTNLSNEIRRATAKETELEDAYIHLRNDLTTETNARKQSDTALQQNINEEVSSRKQGDTALQHNLNAEVSAREQGDNKNNAEIAKIHSNITSIENKNTEQDNEISTLRTMISTPYNFKGDVASISALPARGEVNDTYYVKDVKYKVTWNGSAWIQSSLSEADYQTELGGLKRDLVELGENFEQVHYNWCDNENIVLNKRYDFSTGKLSFGIYNGMKIIPPFPVKSGDSLLICADGNVQPFVYTGVCDANGNVLETQSGNPPYNITHDGYAYVTTVYSDPRKVMVSKTGLLYDFIPYSKLKEFNIVGYDYLNIAKRFANNNKIYVGSNKTFNTIKEAVNSITDSSEDKVYDIYIDDGTYNENDITLPDYVNLIGTSGIRENCIIYGHLPETSVDSDISRISTINMSRNNELRNITIIGQNVRYPVHDESGGGNTDWTQYVDNCFIEHKGNQEVIDYRIANGLDYSGVWKSYHAWGEGASSGAYLKITNSTLKSVGDAFYVHGASNMIKPYRHILENCQLLVSKNISPSIFVDNTTSQSGIENTVEVRNCYINGRVACLGNNESMMNIFISGSGLAPIYQKPEHASILNPKSFPIFTDHFKKMVASENIETRTFVYSEDGKTIKKATSTTPREMILGYTVGNVTVDNLVNVAKGYIQYETQTWPETDNTTNKGKYFKLNDNGKLVESTSTNDIRIGYGEYRQIRLFV